MTERVGGGGVGGWVGERQCRTWHLVLGVIVCGETRGVEVCAGVGVGLQDLLTPWDGAWVGRLLHMPSTSTGLGS